MRWFACSSVRSVVHDRSSRLRNFVFYYRDSEKRDRRQTIRSAGREEMQARSRENIYLYASSRAAMSRNFAVIADDTRHKELIKANSVQPCRTSVRYVTTALLISPDVYSPPLPRFLSANLPTVIIARLVALCR